ncbi:unnamed protein product, partial [Tetraodon nigroviridis]
PIKMSEPLFNGFDRIGKKQNKEQVPPATEPHHPRKAPAPREAKASAPSSRVTSGTHKNLAEAFKALDLGDLRQQLAHSQTLFPDNPSVWFKDLAGYLNLYLTAPDTGPTLSSHTHGGSGALAWRGPSPGL